MVRKILILVTPFIFLAAAVNAGSDALTDRLDLSTNAFRELMQASDASIPRDLLQKCEAIVIFPRTINVAWGLGGQYGKGVALKRDRSTGRWSQPAFYMIGGLTLGPQIGGETVDIVLVVLNERGLTSLLNSKCTLGGDAGIAIGPVGRKATASTDLLLTAEILSYSRAKGLYVGMSVKGAVVMPDNEANRLYYKSDLSARQILLERQGQLKDGSKPLLKTINRFAPPKSTFFGIQLLSGFGIFIILFALFLVIWGIMAVVRKRT